MKLSDWINSEYLKEKKIAELNKQFLAQKPFSYLELEDFFIKEKLIDFLKAFSQEQFFEKESDLFKFKQTNDLANCKNKVIQKMLEVLYSKEFVAYMKKITNLPLLQKADIAGTLYEDTDFLLCHDDQLDSRKIAFMLYLSTFSENEGGELNIFTSKKKLPDKIIKKIFPEFNKFTFFEVSEISFHSVEEVTAEKQRITLGGWYHA